MSRFGSILLYIEILLTLGLALWPEPTHFEFGNSVLWLSPDAQFKTSMSNGTTNQYPRNFMYVALSESLGYIYSQLLNLREGDWQQSQPVSEQVVLRSAIERTLKSITSTNFVPWKFHPRSKDFEPQKDKSHQIIDTIQIDQRTNATETIISAEDFFSGNECYSINVFENGVAEIKSNSTLGTIRALQTFEQLFYTVSDLSGVYTPLAPISIIDCPKWRHRGLNLDISRNAFSPKDVMRTIKAMATCKMSRLHLHATDAQSWPLEIPALPALADKGSYQSHLQWSPKDLQAVQFYGLQHGISVFLEIDMPGHTSAVANAYPELVAAFNESDWSTFAAEFPSGSLKLNSSAVYEFIDKLFSDLLPRVSAYTTLFHNGGDEVNPNPYLLDETVKSNSSSVLQPLVQKFMSNVTGMVRAAGLTPIVWEEMLLDWNLTFPSVNNDSSGTPDILVQVWLGTESLRKVLDRGYRALFGDYHNWYLDCGHGGFVNPYPAGVSPLGVPYNQSGGVRTQIKDPFPDYCSPLKNWRHIYVYNPCINVTSDVQHLIEGGEVHMWSEQTDPVSLDNTVWPRAAAAAEVLWSGVMQA